MLRAVYPREVLVDCVKASIALGSGTIGSLVSLTRRNLVEKGICSFGRWWRLPYKLTVSLEVGRERFRHAWPYQRVAAGRSRAAWLRYPRGKRAEQPVVDTTAEMIRILPAVLADVVPAADAAPAQNLHARRLSCARKDWALTEDETDVLSLVVGCLENKEIAAKLGKTENQIARCVSLLFERAKVPRDWGNRRMNLMAAFQRLPG